MKNNKYLLALVLSLSLVSLSGQKAFAEEVKTNPIKERLTELKQERKELVGERCEAIGTRVDERISRFDSNKGFHQEQYAKLKERLASIITKLNAKGVDTSKLSSDLSTLDSKVSKFSTDYAAFIAKLKTAKTYTCGDSQGQFKTAMQEARDSLKIVKQDVADIKDFYTNTVKVDVKAIRDSLAEKKTTTTN